MSKSGKLFVFGLASLLLAGCQSGTLKAAGPQASAAPNGVPGTVRLRTSAEMRQAVGTDGFTAWGHDTKGDEWESYTAPDGTAVVRSGSFVDHGVWHIVPGGKFCLRWHKIRDGAETCLTQYVEGNNIYNILPDGSIVSVQTRQVSGNPDHL